MPHARILVLLISLMVFPTWAAKIVQFSPQGEVARVESIKVAFDAPVIQFGDDQAPAPLDVVCDAPGVKGHGRWVDGKRWTYVFTAAPGPGVQCSATARLAFRTLSGQTLSGPTQFAFRTGGPRVVQSRPWEQTIDEDQVFVLQFNGEVTPESVLENTVCLVEGLGETVNVRLVNGAMRKAALKAYYFPSEADDASLQVLQCKRLLPADANVQLRVGKGVRAVSGVASSKVEKFDFQVRSPFQATFSCERENADAACTPVSPVSLNFSAPIAIEDAKKIRLTTSEGELVPASDDPAYANSVSYVRFNGPFAALSDLTISLPQGLKDDAGRELSNSDQFPLVTRTADYPPLVKFAAASFGVIERFANQPLGGSEADYPPAVPVTVRKVEPSLGAKEISVSAGRVRDHALQNDKDVLHWYARIQRLGDGNRWTPAQLRAIMADQKPEPDAEKAIDTRGYSVLKSLPGARQLDLPVIAKTKEDARPFEVIGIPVQEPGFHIIEVESARLGQALLEPPVPMYVRTSALVTNLGVHIKRGRDDVLAWVTTLDEGKVVAGASITVLDCSGQELAKGKTDAQGIWHYPQVLKSESYCEDTGLSGIYVSAKIPAKHPLARNKADFAFVMSGWDRGIESWRFNVPTDTSQVPSLAAHTVFDRTLLRAGETVSMKHFIRMQTRDGFSLPPPKDLPGTMVIEHQGSDQRYEQALNWTGTRTGGLNAVSRFSIPKTAKLGVYSVTLKDSANHWLGQGEFRIEEFKLPVLTGNLKISDEDDSSVLVAPESLNADVQISYVSGGPAGQLPVSLSGVASDKWVRFGDYDDYSFDPPAVDGASTGGDATGDEDTSDEARGPAQYLFLNKKSLVLDAQGGGRLKLDAIPAVSRPKDFLFEASFADPNGEIQTLSQTVTVWPASVVPGIRTGSWVQAGQSTDISTVALSPSGQAQAGVDVVVSAISRITYSTRKRMVGGFYSYDNKTQIRDLGTVCQGKTDEKGVLGCAIELKESGSIQLVASVKDAQGRRAKAASTVWVVGGAELWFGGENDDRIDIIPEKKSYRPGETANFQVRMPFREALALVAVEREGVLDTQVVALKGNNPNVSIPIKPEWGPNVYVSVLVLRGRLRDVPWYSIFTWGWRQPAAWYSAFASAGGTYVAPTAFIDLSKPAFRFGLAEIQVSDTQDQLSVKVSSDQKTYPVRGKAAVTVQVTKPDGTPAAYGNVAFAAVDQALLELSPNLSWDLLGAMRQRRSYGVETATAQMEIVGRRHYGRKALPAGGGGGKSPTRELLDTLLLWQPSVPLDQDGKAQLNVPLNDAISRFKLVAVADYGVGRFGTGSTSVATTQDLQVISGLPAVVREGDRYQAMATVRNSTSRDMTVEVGASYSGSDVPDEALTPQSVRLPAGMAQTVSWTLTAPEGNLLSASSTLKWLLQAHEKIASEGAVGKAVQESRKAATDRLSINQSLVPAVPVTARQATLTSFSSSEPVNLAVAVPEGALLNANGTARGGLDIFVQASLAGGLPGVKEWFARYPYTCLEQLGSKAIGLRSVDKWRALMHQLPNYLDGDGLAAYFPGAQYGSEVLTAYLLVASNEARAMGLDFVIPDSSKEAMTRGLLAFAQGKIVRHRWAPQEDLDIRKLLVLEALSREGLVKARMLDSITISPNHWPTSAVIDWLALLQRVPEIPDRAVQLKQVRQIIQARLLSRGTELSFADDANSNWWWLMLSPEVNMAKLMLTAMGRPEWKEDMPRLAQGLMLRQRNGAWRTTTANLMGSLALEKFARHFEQTPVSGVAQIGLASDPQTYVFDWNAIQNGSKTDSMRFFSPWTKARSDTLHIEQKGTGQAWATVRSMVATRLAKPVTAGYEVSRKISPVSQSVPGTWTRGDVYRINIDVVAKTSMTWAVLTDPVPAGAAILGSGLGRDSVIDSRVSLDDHTYRNRPSFVERTFEAYRVYYEYLPQGKTSIEYTVRLNTAGQFQLPPTRIEALYEPDVYGELPNEGLAVQAEAIGQPAPGQP